MPEPNAKKRNRVKGVAPRGFFRRWKLIWITLGVLLLIPGMQVAVELNRGWTRLQRYAKHCGQGIAD